MSDILFFLLRREQACLLVSSLFFQTALGYYLSGPKTTEAVMYITQHILQFSFSLKISILMPLWLDNSENYSLKLLILNILELLVVNFGAHDLPQIDGKG